jgi:hypothetical protein
MQYAEGIPLSCPPGDVERRNTHFFKAIDGKNPSERDFLSFAEKDRPNVDKGECSSWGLSVWPDMEAVEHARKVFDFFRRKKIVQFAVTADDGAYLATPLPDQAKHHTFWKCSNRSVLSTCVVVLEGTKS